jgi:hypothetical protein
MLARKAGGFPHHELIVDDVPSVPPVEDPDSSSSSVYNLPGLQQASGTRKLPIAFGWTHQVRVKFETTWILPAKMVGRKDDVGAGSPEYIECDAMRGRGRPRQCG